MLGSARWPSLLAAPIPNEEALALAPTIGWLMLACAVCTVTLFIVYREGWRRLWLRAEDPRAMGLFRIAFGICALCNVNGLWELFGYLFTDEGIFVTDVAREVYAREQFAGFGNGLDGDPYGFLDLAGFWQWLKGPKYSLLFFNSTPGFFWMHLVAFEVAMVCLIIGFKTRYTKWIAWFLFHSIILRCTIYWEGTENIYRCFFFYLCLSRCDRAYSVDNWLRCRKLAKAGRLSQRGGPGGGAGTAPDKDGNPGLEAIYRRIPSWPRILLILQSGAIYCYTGVVKNGAVWWKGDAFYYAFNLDHFHRVPPQVLSAYVGTTLFRVNSHVAHAWESLFPLLVFGLVARFVLRDNVPALSSRARHIATATWIALGLGALAICWIAYPVHFTQPKRGPFAWVDIGKMQLIFAGLWLSGMALVFWGWRRLRDRPFNFKFRGKAHVLDLDTFLKWTCGRRVWLAIGTIFHVHLIVMMNIGWFSPGALTGFIAFLNGSEIALLLAGTGGLLARVRPFAKWIPASVRNGLAPIPAEDPTLPHLHRDAATLPLLTLVGGGVIATAGVWMHLEDHVHYGWTLVGLLLFLFGSTLREMRTRAAKESLIVVQRPGDDGPDGQPAEERFLTAPWAYGPLGRLLVSCLFIYQTVAVAVWLLPDKSIMSWRIAARAPFEWWLGMSQTTQGWKMFAPNPPRRNVYLRVLVTDHDGEVYDLNTDMYHPSQRPVPWIFYTRQRKINRRVAGSEGGKGSWYQKWHSRFHCRQWAMDHDGVLPKEVELVKITYPIPSPDTVWRDGPYDPMELLRTKSTQKSLLTTDCADDVGAQPLDTIRLRHGLDKSDVKVKRWVRLRGRAEAWERRKERKAEAERRKRETGE